MISGVPGGNCQPPSIAASAPDSLAWPDSILMALPLPASFPHPVTTAPALPAGAAAGSVITHTTTTSVNRPYLPTTSDILSLYAGMRAVPGPAVAGGART